MRECDILIGGHLSTGDKQEGKGSQESCLRFIQQKARRMGFMIDMLYEIKAETPVGRILVILVNVILRKEISPAEKIDLCHISLPVLAELAGVTEEELQESIDFLQLKGIIAKKNTVP
ncbi:MAG: hypothetical protein JL50_00085 [Peptococcaceae bacterium BICA1-7]|nr:MAG: hypothetical protein JL50_00085 [Peptococcaceae bacterium BICA1-7]HBV98218.1 hypothetical protein [Desulfotomaculum sp.]